MNLIVFNLDESTSRETSERKQYDLDKFIELCNKIGAQEVDVKLTLRLGNYKQSKTRALKVILNNKRQRKEILDNAKKIKSLPVQTKLNGCIIIKDLTPRQRELNKARRLDKHNNKLQPEKTQDFDDETIRDDTCTNVSTILKSVDCMQQQPVQIVNTLDQSKQSDFESQSILKCNYMVTNTKLINAILASNSEFDDTVVGGIQNTSIMMEKDEGEKD